MKLAEVYKALADENRLRILHALSRGSFNVQEITSIIHAGQSTLSHHLKTLQSAGLITLRRDGTRSYFKLVSNGGDKMAFRVLESFLAAKDLNGSAETFAQDAEQIRGLLDERRESARMFFNKVAKDWSDLRSTIIDESTYLTRVTAQISPDCTFLDLGCGSGAFLKSILPRTGKTYGVDYSVAMLEEAQRQMPSGGGVVKLELGYLETLPVQNEEVDVALAHMVLHHIDEPLEVLRDTFRVLKHGGKLVVADLVEHNQEIMRERYADVWLGFNIGEFTEWLRECGYSAISTEFVGPNREVFLITALKH